MGGHRLTVIALSLTIVSACSPGRPVTLDGAINDGPELDKSVPAMSWAISAGGTGSSSGFGASVDSAGNSYVTGKILATAIFGSTALTSKGSGDIFVAKLDSNGKWLWATSAGGTDVDRGFGISVDSASNSNVTGSFQGTADFGSTSLTAKGPSDVFVWRVGKGGY
jgi:hypothetical protein